MESSCFLCSIYVRKKGVHLRVALGMISLCAGHYYGTWGTAPSHHELQQVTLQADDLDQYHRTGWEKPKLPDNQAKPSIEDEVACAMILAQPRQTRQAKPSKKCSERGLFAGKHQHKIGGKPMTSNAWLGAVRVGKGGAGVFESGRRLGCSRTMVYDVQVKRRCSSPAMYGFIRGWLSGHVWTTFEAGLPLPHKARLDEGVQERLDVKVNGKADLGNLCGVLLLKTHSLFHFTPRKGVHETMLRAAHTRQVAPDHRPLSSWRNTGTAA